MCTAISVNKKNHYFGRNLDFEHTFGEQIIITPRNYRFYFKNGEERKAKNAIIGMGIEKCGYPLYFDAVNEKGLGIAGLNFPENAHYNEKKADKINIASFEVIPYILSECENLSDTKKLLSDVNITKEAFSAEITPTPLHFLIADKSGAICLEQTERGIEVYENPVGVLTNNPEFTIQLFNLSNYMSVSAKETENRFSQKINLKAYSRGMGTIGLPGDFSSASRFVRASFTKLNSEFGDSENEILHQFFHILYSVYQLKGCVKTQDDFVITNYTSCCNTDKGIYYYTTYYNSNICAVDMHKENLNGENLICYPLKNKAEIFMHN